MKVSCQYFVRSADGIDYMVGSFLNGIWYSGNREDALKELAGLGERGAYVWAKIHG